ncbi:NADH-quinone oxidoreductase subunit H, partial [termite gut metagenome]
MFDFSIITNWIHQWLVSFMPEYLAIIVECICIGVIIIVMYALLAIILIYMERKVCAFFQCRIGPNRVGKWGSLQLFADVIKMLIKEIISLKQADRFLYELAPLMVITASILAFSCLPVSKGLMVLDFNIGIVFLLAASSIGVIGILLAGWGSNNKLSLLGSMRCGAQMISYELS